MSKTYTQHKLTNAQLVRLSPIVKGRPHKHGVALEALIRKGLVIENESVKYVYATDHITGQEYGTPQRIISYNYTAAQSGIEALHDARKEGW